MLAIWILVLLLLLCLIISNLYLHFIFFPDGVTSYSMPQGDTNTLIGPSFVPYDFRDQTYDGQLIGSTGQLTNGLGQLMDNVAYLGNITYQSDSYPSQPGFHFVGWKRPADNKKQTDLNILFRFDEGRLTRISMDHQIDHLLFACPFSLSHLTRKTS